MLVVEIIHVYNTKLNDITSWRSKICIVIELEI